MKKYDIFLYVEYHIHKEEEKDMENNKKSGSIAAPIILMVIFTIATIALIATNADLLFGEPTDFGTMIEEEGKPVKDEFVSLDVELVYDWYAEMEYKINGIIPAGTEKYCVVYLEEYDAFVSLTVKGKDNYKKIDKLISESDDYMSGSTNDLPKSVTFEGKIKTIDHDVDSYYSEFESLFNSYYGIYGWTPEFYEVTIDSTDTKLSTWGYIGFCVLMVVFSTIALVVNVKKKKADKLQGI